MKKGHCILLYYIVIYGLIFFFQVAYRINLGAAKTALAFRPIRPCLKVGRYVKKVVQN